MAAIRERPIWCVTDEYGIDKVVPYDQIIVPAGTPVYMGGSTPKILPYDLEFPNPLDSSERGFGVDRDFFNGDPDANPSLTDLIIPE